MDIDESEYLNACEFNGGQNHNMAGTPNGEYIEGFSGRFMKFLDIIGVDRKGRYSYGNRVCSVSVNGFKRWCVEDVAPRTMSKLEDCLIQLANSKGISKLPTKKLMAWLYFGYEKDYPFSDHYGFDCKVVAKKIYDHQGLWALVFFYSRQIHNLNVNLLPTDSRKMLIRDIITMSYEKFGLEITSENFEKIVHLKNMGKFRENLDEVIKNSFI